MNFRVKQWIVAVLSLFFLGSLITVGFIESGRLLPEKKAKVVVTAKNESCVNCHTEKSPGIVKQWEDSRHAPLGVGCVDCHAAKKGEPDAWEHEGSLIATIVSPKDCARCHEKVAKEFTDSHHSKAAKFIGSLDNFLGVVVEGAPAAINGCQKCHGSTVKVLKSGKLDPATWPNTGVGRINPDGSNGACTACHSRHTFSAAQARQPENCGKCHMGPDHPQIEIYNESKHGIAFRARINEMNLDSKSWIVGKDYSAAPTCATCHMSATRDLPITHDVGKRISWTLRPVISKKLKNWEAKRKDMQNVCSAC
ncbi:MAG: hydroxylamine oxidoreductase, partial [Nitrospinaceae bacterium]|nr:hydroxylamine oxidoreductase [Nitrospinaceae bacterium]